MDNSIKFIRIPLIITGFDIFRESNEFSHKILRLTSYITISFVLASLCHGIAFEKEMDFSDQIFVHTAIQALGIVLFQLTHFWHHRNKIVKIFDDVKELHITRKGTLDEEYSRTLLEKSLAFLVNLCK